MPAPARQAPRRPRIVHYPETDHMGEHELQRFITELLRPLIERWIALRGEVAHAGADTFMYWVEGDPTQRVAPDVYVLPGIAQSVEASSWLLWETGVPPSFALEIVSSNWSKDYFDVPVSYSALGAKELVIFDPFAKATHRHRFRWQVYRRVKGRGLIRVEVSQGDRVKSRGLGCWLRAVPEGTSVRLRLADGEEGARVFPTEREAETARADGERARADGEQARADALAAENARLAEELAALRRR